MKPLYIEGAETRVESEGAALRILRPSKADRWFPLRCVSQVISAVQVDWSTPALLACADQGITVSFIGDEGSIRARVLGKAGEGCELARRLADFLLRPDWNELYEQWRGAMEQMAVRSVARRSGLAFAEVPSARSLRQMFHEAADSTRLQAAHERLGGEIHGLLVALVTQRLSETGVTAAPIDAQGLFLANDLAGILFWDFQLARLAWLEDRLTRECVGTPQREEIVAFFESRRARTERLTAGLINRLHRWLIELY